MTYLNVDGINRVLSCKILSEKNDFRFSRSNISMEEINKPWELKFEDGIAIARVEVKATSFWGEERHYVTYTVIREVRNEETNEVEDYELANKDDRYFCVPQFVTAIWRAGNNFFFEVLTSNDDETVSWNTYFQYEYDKETKKFKDMGKLMGRPTVTQNPDIIVLTNSDGSQLYSLKERMPIGERHSSIEGIDGNKLFVMDCICARGDNDTCLKNHLMFQMDTTGKKVSKVYSRNKGEFTDDEAEVPYEDVIKSEIQVLKDTLEKEKDARKLLKSTDNKEQ